MFEETYRLISLSVALRSDTSAPWGAASDAARSASSACWKAANAAARDLTREGQEKLCQVVFGDALSKERERISNEREKTFSLLQDDRFATPYRRCLAGTISDTYREIAACERTWRNPTPGSSWGPRHDLISLMLTAQAAILSDEYDRQLGIQRISNERRLLEAQLRFGVGNRKAIKARLAALAAALA